AFDRPLDPDRQGPHETAELFVRDRYARKPARDDEAPQMTLILDRVGEREHPAVAVPQQVDPPEAQGLPDALGFLDGSLDREERGPSRPFALANPELVVEDDPIAERGEVREAREVSVRY